MIKGDIVIKIAQHQIVGFEHFDGTPLTPQQIKHLRYMLDRDFPKPCYVYVGIHEGNPAYVKIGISHTPYERADKLGLVLTRLVMFSQRESAMSFEKTLLGMRPINAADEFINSLENPTEWFRKTHSGKEYGDILIATPGRSGEDQSINDRPSRGKYIRS